MRFILLTPADCSIILDMPTHGSWSHLDTFDLRSVPDQSLRDHFHSLVFQPYNNKGNSMYVHIF